MVLLDTIRRAKLKKGVEAAWAWPSNTREEGVWEERKLRGERVSVGRNVNVYPRLTVRPVLKAERTIKLNIAPIIPNPIYSSEDIHAKGTGL